MCWCVGPRAAVACLVLQWLTDAPQPSYFSSEWSMSHFLIPPHSLCVFGPEPQSILAISADGMFYKFVLDEKSGSARRVVCESFLNAAGDQ